jgi:squalene-hopene/tetraprenyl-beta-curcumene cyclase
MRNSSLALALFAASCAVVAPALVAAGSPADTNRTTSGNSGKWDKAAAAKYLDDREVWWQEWPHAQKDHGTVCVSCHTQVPYALARPALRRQLGEQKLSDPERAMLDSIVKRVNLGSDAETFYSDAVHGPGKTREARNAEAVNNALILASYDASAGHLEPVTRKALDAMWAGQEQGGAADSATRGAWIWQNFHFSPWEAPESEYWGAAMAAVAAGIAPDNYRNDLKIQPNLSLLRDYLRRQAPNQPLINRVVLLWASSKLPGLMTAKERAALAAEISTKQHEDGGWSLTELGQGTWKRRDNTAFDLRSDGYATGMIVLALEDSGAGQDTPELKRGVAWLLANQSKADGRWPAWSVNVKRDPESGVGKFMSDAATGFAVLALEHSHVAAAEDSGHGAAGASR